MMELRLDEIRKKQEQTILQMEREIPKREIIKIKYAQSEDEDQQKRKAGKENRTHIQKQIQNLKGALQQSTKNSDLYEKKLMSLRSQLSEKGQMIRDMENTSLDMENDLSDKLMLLSKNKIDKVVNVFEISKLQKKAQ